MHNPWSRVIYMYPIWIKSCEYLRTHAALSISTGEDNLVFGNFTLTDVGGGNEGVTVFGGALGQIDPLFFCCQ